MIVRFIKRILGIDIPKKVLLTEGADKKERKGNLFISDLNMTAYQFFTETSEDEREQVLDEVIQEANKDQKEILDRYERKYAGVR